MIMLLTIIQGVSIGILIPAIIWAVKQVNSHRHKHEVLEISQRAQLRHNLINACTCAIKNGYLSYLELESINDQFDIYKVMLGNGLVHNLVEKTNKLPIEE